ncbi:hypothetical protein [Psychrobacter sp.]|uniref:hypothetical protein n=1 Tax=Psychrobacter sp. TaxID=56811 RepID=UPI002648E3A1|nr:hypothetical protein [Psychrobacter sp.]MDN6276623.1 hypothetical protein [Psychrobacter sp.]MDN6307888.1 hypothetical protein [Psychrobacter sp.]
MSDIQDPLIVLQRRKQQRQILAMMGVEQWVQPESARLNIADISVADDDQSSSPARGVSTSDLDQATAESKEINADASDHDLSATANQPTSVYSDSVDGDSGDSSVLMKHSSVNEENPVNDSYGSSTSAAPIDSYVYDGHSDSANSEQQIEKVIEPLVDAVAMPSFETIEQDSASSTRNDDSAKKIEPFDLQGGRYGNWVLLVDIQALNNDSQKLWRNITQALSITCETTSFPICEGMDTAELANASLAGYVFKIGRSEDVQVVSLTTLPEGLAHSNLASVPTLDEMLDDSSLKRQFWEQISI